MVDLLTAVGIQKTAAPDIGLQVELQTPNAPEKIHMPVADAASAKVDEAGKIPLIQHDVGQTVISVKEGIGLQIGGIFPCDADGFFGRGKSVVTGGVAAAGGVIAPNGI